MEDEEDYPRGSKGRQRGQFDSTQAGGRLRVLVVAAVRDVGVCGFDHLTPEGKKA